MLPLQAVARSASHTLVPGAGWGSLGAGGPEPLAWPPPPPPPSGSLWLPLGYKAESLLAWPVCSVTTPVLRAPKGRGGKRVTAPAGTKGLMSRSYVQFSQNGPHKGQSGGVTPILSFPRVQGLF